MQGRFNFLESGLHIFEIILLLKIDFFFMTLHLLLGSIIYSDTGFAKLKKSVIDCCVHFFSLFRMKIHLNILRLISQRV